MDQALSGQLSLAADETRRLSPSPPVSNDQRAVARRWLVRRLLAAREVPLVLLAAPAGYGKSTLLAQWERADPREFLWLDQDPGAGDPLPALWRALEQAREPRSEIRAHAITRARSHGRSGQQFPTPMDHARGLVIVIDDAHTIVRRNALDLLQRVVASLPGDSQLVLSSRTLPPLAIGRLRTRRQILELGSEDLRMNETEADSLLAIAGLRLSQQARSAVMTRTEGWPAALDLAALSMSQRTDPSATADPFTSECSAVLPYLHEEVLGELSVQAARVLRRCSIADSLSGSLCDALLGERGSGAILARLAHGRFLLIEHRGGVYRWRPLIRDAAAACLCREEPELIRGLHRTASRWFERAGNIDAAIEHAVAGDDHRRLRRLLSEHLFGYLAAGRATQINGWLAGCDRGRVESQPTLCVCAAHAHLAEGELRSAARWRLACGQPDEPTAHRNSSQPCEALLVLLDGVLARRGLESMRESAERSAELERPHSPWQTYCCLLGGVAATLSGELERGHALFSEGIDRSSDLNAPVELMCHAQLALIALEQNDWCQAQEHCELGSRLGSPRWIGGAPRTLLLGAAALLAAQMGRSDEASQLLHDAEEGVEALEELPPWYEFQITLSLARTTAQLTDIARSRTLLAQASRAARRLGDAPQCISAIDRAWEECEQHAAGALDQSAALTLAELRVLRFLPTHLSFREIGGRLHVSTNTVKSQALAVYRKLDAHSRSEAVAHAARAGLIWGPPAQPGV